MQVGLIGLPGSGKSTLFNALTRGNAETGRFGGGAAAANRGRTLVPDPRLDWLADLYAPKKKTPASVDFIDVPGITPGSTEKGANALLADLRTVDALVHVVRVFDDPAVPHPDRTVDPVRDVTSLDTELLLADLVPLEKRLERIDSDLKKGFDPRKLGAEKELLGHVRDALMEGRAARLLDLDAAALRELRGYAFLTMKPVIIVGNVGEAEPSGGASDAKLRAYAESSGMSYLAVSAKIESEIAAMDDAHAHEFLSHYGLTDSSRDRVIRAAYEALALLSFFTFGEDECKAWMLPRRSSAVEAAGKIHSDIARGFIRAEVVSFDVFKDVGSWNAAKDVGKHRLEGRDYEVQDGDCVIFRFSV
ncbi:MAG: redox-regulated ATPase YchF [bacterium]